MHIVLIGNYLPDRQQSMQRFANMLHEGLTGVGIESSVWYPGVLFAKGFANTTSGFGKWLGYIDKWLIFPIVLWWRTRFTFASSKYRFHVCDHSNAPYLNYLPDDRTAITCHDVLAIRGALGYSDAYCPATETGKILQCWILRHLGNAKRIATVSKFTLDQLQAITTSSKVTTRNWQVIYNAFNSQFYPENHTESYSLLSKFGLNSAQPFILHVGSNLTRKNRSLLLNMVVDLGDSWKGKICFAGQPLSEKLRTEAQSLGISDRIVEICNPKHNTLLALYSTCQALVFPSFSEGFGWPIIEAQACGAPVITSTVEPMPEVSGGAALLADPTQPHQFAEALLALSESSLRSDLIQRGFTNCSRFQQDIMINAYLDLHRAP